MNHDNWLTTESDTLLSRRQTGALGVLEREHKHWAESLHPTSLGGLAPLCTSLVATQAAVPLLTSLLPLLRVALYLPSHLTVEPPKFRLLRAPFGSEISTALLPASNLSMCSLLTVLSRV